MSLPKRRLRPAKTNSGTRGWGNAGPGMETGRCGWNKPGAAIFCFLPGRSPFILAGKLRAFGAAPRPCLIPTSPPVPYPWGGPTRFSKTARPLATMSSSAAWRMTCSAACTWRKTSHRPTRNVVCVSVAGLAGPGLSRAFSGSSQETLHAETSQPAPIHAGVTDPEQPLPGGRSLRGPQYPGSFNAADRFPVECLGNYQALNLPPTQSRRFWNSY